MDYFNETVKFDPVNHYIILNKDELISLKNKTTKSEIAQLNDAVGDQFISYRKNKISVYNKEQILDFDKHDYVSLATYYWPNENTKDGLPYVLHDGNSNPEGLKYDKDKLRRLAYITYYQALLYYLTDDKVYYEMLKDNCSYFFFEKATKMNPNMNHGQMIKGVNLGRGIGIIDFAANFTYPLIMLKNLERLGYLEDSFNNNMKDWLRDFLDWLCYNPIAIQENYAKNNHGTFYDFLKLVLFDYLDIKKEILPLTYNFIEERMIQIYPDGRMPKELKRTKSISYSLMGLKGIFDYAKIAKNYNIDLYNINDWYFHHIDSSIKKGIDYLIKHLIINDDWAYKQITILDTVTYLPLIYEKRLLDNVTYNIDESKAYDKPLLILYKMLIKL